MRASTTLFQRITTRIATEFTEANLHKGLVFTPASASAALRVSDPHHWPIDPKLVEELGFHPDSAPLLRRPTRPTVLLLGWWGSSPARLAHYRDLYVDLGYDTLVHNAPMRHAFYPRSTVRRNWDILATLEAYRKLRGPDLHIVIHAMSNNGAYNAACLGALMRLSSEPPKNPAPADKGFLYTGVATEIAVRRMLPEGGKGVDYSHLRQCVTGIILDSAPSLITPPVMAQAAAIVMTGKANLSSSARAYGLSGLTWKAILEKVFGFWMSRPTVVSGLDGLLFPSLDRIPSLFPEARYLLLYSAADALVPAESVEEFERHLNALGAPTRSVEFIGSGHVAHYRGKNKTRYTESVGTFLKDCAWGASQGVVLSADVAKLMRPPPTTPRMSNAELRGG